MLTKQEEDYISGIAAGLTPPQAAKKVGYTKPLASKEVQRRLQQLTRNAKDRQKFSRRRVDEMIQRAYDVAEMTDDAGSMVRAVGEINKMNGFYAPEEHIVSRQGQRVLTALGGMSTEELIRLADADVIEGEVLNGDG